MAFYTSATTLARRIGETPQAVLDTAAELRLGCKGPHKNSPLVLDESACVQIHTAILKKEIAAIEAKTASIQAERLKNATHMGFLAPLARMQNHPCTVDLEKLATLTAKLPAPLAAEASYKEKVDYLCKTKTVEPQIFAIQKRISAALAKI